MTPRRFRIVIMCSVLVGVSATVALTIAAFQQNMLFFYTPTQLLQDSTDMTRTFRVGGLVEQGSVYKAPDSLEVSFSVTDTVNSVIVAYRGVLPDLFREGQGVVIRGHWRDGIFMADEVLAKHDENYMPPEVYDALKAAQSIQQ